MANSMGGFVIKKAAATIIIQQTSTLFLPYMTYFVCVDTNGDKNVSAGDA